MEIEIIRFIGAMCFVGFMGFWLARHKEALSLLSPRRAWGEAKRMSRRKWLSLAFYSTVFIGISLLVIPLVANFLVSTVGQPLTDPREHPVTITAATSIPLAFFLMGTLPIFEEWIWRGILLERLRRRRPIIIAILLSTLGFGFCHLLNSGTYFWAFVPPVVAGFIFSMAYLKGGLKCAIISHSGYNLIALALVFLGIYI